MNEVTLGTFIDALEYIKANFKVGLNIVELKMS